MLAWSEEVRPVEQRETVGRLDGAWVWARLSPEQRVRFRDELAFALRGARLTFEVEPVAAVVRRWWLEAGGPAETAAQDEAAAREDALITRRPHPPQQDPTRWVDRTGPAVHAALSDDDRARFELDFSGALSRAESLHDHRAPLAVIHDWWGTALREANPEQNEKDADLARRIEAGDMSMFPSP
ncbi:DUF6247 family protein [Streptomyces sp. DSM 44917]|uniref:DUF6247 family protein n=1 Tax=Streptomyces boetiae TaxID=3075541 RepID=A0ABU2L739_9ACTN|nr:DUF6247 family protein [Streptomyces sp. DSM 44917]MDT0307384.1 DUF6247 family protein [Streptomyces sp. DSM 44917]